MDLKSVCDNVLAHPGIKYHNFEVSNEDRENTIIELEKFCRCNNYQLCINYYTNNNPNTFSIKLIRTNLTEDQIKKQNEKNKPYEFPWLFLLVVVVLLRFIIL